MKLSSRFWRSFPQSILWLWSSTIHRRLQQFFGYDFLLWIPKFRHCHHKKPPLDANLKQLSLIHIFSAHLCKIYLNIILPSKGLQSGLFLSDFLHRLYESFSNMLHVQFIMTLLISAYCNDVDER